MADSRIAYGLAKKHGIDTTGMSPQQVWDALKEKGVSLGADREADKERIAKKYGEDNTYLQEKSFIQVQLFSPGIEQMTPKEMIKSQRSIAKKKKLHEDKISNPSKYIPNWDNYSEQKKKGQIIKWQKEIINYDNQLKRIKERLDEQ